MTAVEVQNVSKYYALDRSQWMRMRRVFSPAHRVGGHEVCALRDVNFQVEEGEAFGIIGSNGSGKSTLLQIIAGILRPSTGSVTMNGRCSTLLELGSGFSPEFTGRQNVFLNGTILGLSEEELCAKFESIEKFAGIGDFIDQPIRTYSTGMVLRLAFAVAAHSDPRILIVDEALAVGDVAFRQRCLRRIHELRAAGVTILFVSHDTGDVKALCERCLWLERGVVRGLGEADDVVARYLATTLDRSKTVVKHTQVTSIPRPQAASIQRPQAASIQRPQAASIQRPQAAVEHAIAEPVAGTRRFGNGSAEITGVRFNFAFGDADGLLTLQITGRQRVTAPIAGFLVRNEKGESIFGSNSARENHPLASLEAGDERRIDFRITMPRLATGKYSVSVAISDGNIGEFEVCDYIEDAVTFDVASARSVSGYIELPCSSVAIRRESSRENAGSTRG